MSSKQDQIQSNVFDVKEKDLNEKDHNIDDLQIYPESTENMTCWQKFKNCMNNFVNRTIDYFEYDRVFNAEGEPTIDLKKCYKRFLQNYDQTYSEREMRFAFSFDYVLQEKIKEQQKKEKNFWNEFYRFICCEGGNQMEEIDEAYKSQREYQRIIKKRLLEKKEEFQEMMKRQQQEKREELQRQKQKQNAQNREKLQQIINNDSLSFYDDVQGKEEVEKRKKVENPTHLNTKLLKVNETEQHILASQIIEDEKSNRTHKKGQQTNANSNIFYNNQAELDDIVDTRHNKYAKNFNNNSDPYIIKKSSEKILTNSSTEQNIVSKTIYHQNHVYNNVIHEEARQSNKKKRNRINEEIDDFQEEDNRNRRQKRTNQKERKEDDDDFFDYGNEYPKNNTNTNLNQYINNPQYKHNLEYNLNHQGPENQQNTQNLNNARNNVDSKSKNTSYNQQNGLQSNPAYNPNKSNKTTGNNIHYPNNTASIDGGLNIDSYGAVNNPNNNLGNNNKDPLNQNSSINPYQLNNNKNNSYQGVLNSSSYPQNTNKNSLGRHKNEQGYLATQNSLSPHKNEQGYLARPKDPSKKEQQTNGYNIDPTQKAYANDNTNNQLTSSNRQPNSQQSPQKKKQTDDFDYQFNGEDPKETLNLPEQSTSKARHKGVQQKPNNQGIQDFNVENKKNMPSKQVGQSEYILSKSPKINNDNTEIYFDEDAQGRIDEPSQGKKRSKKNQQQADPRENNNKFDMNDDLARNQTPFSGSSQGYPEQSYENERSKKQKRIKNTRKGQQENGLQIDLNDDINMQQQNVPAEQARKKKKTKKMMQNQDNEQEEITFDDFGAYNNSNVYLNNDSVSNTVAVSGQAESVLQASKKRRNKKQLRPKEDELNIEEVVFDTFIDEEPKAEEMGFAKAQKKKRKVKQRKEQENNDEQVIQINF